MGTDSFIVSAFLENGSMQALITNPSMILLCSGFKSITTRLSALSDTEAQKEDLFNKRYLWRDEKAQVPINEVEYRSSF